MFNELNVTGDFCLVDIDWTVDHHGLNFLFINHNLVKKSFVIAMVYKYNWTTACLVLINNHSLKWSENETVSVIFSDIFVLFLYLYSHVPDLMRKVFYSMMLIMTIDQIYF